MIFYSSSSVNYENLLFHSWSFGVKSDWDHYYPVSGIGFITGGSE
jgi:hypothetical protein